MKLPNKKEPEHSRQSVYLPELVDQAFSHLPTALCANLLLSFLLVLLFWHEVLPTKLIIWISTLWFITFARFLHFLKYRSRKNSEFKLWAYQFGIGTLATGIAWGAAGVFIFPESSLPHQIFLAFLIGGLISGVTTSLAAMQKLLRIFILLLTFPIILRFIIIGGEIHLTMAIMVATYAGFCVIMSFSIHKMLINSIRLQHENREEIAERTKAEDNLQKAHEQLEIKVKERTFELQKALDEVKVLRGILPICSLCKKIRNDEGYYEQIESYIHKHSGVDFSHTICPECIKKHYPEVDAE